MRGSVLLLCLSGACRREPTGALPHSGGDDDDDADCTVDADADGASACDDCDDDDPSTHPGAPERCDEIDNDCDGAPAPEEGPACFACERAGFWAGTRGLTGAALVDALHALTSDQTCRDYQEERRFLFVTLDRDGSGQVECVYTGRKVAVGSTEPDPTDMNTEHTWPQSWGAEFPPMECDLHHLYPSDAFTNAERGNLPFGDVTHVTDTYGDSVRGTDAGGTTVFEPRDVHKGNVARSMLYFAMRYGYAVDASDLALYRSWDQLDPADDAEIGRSEAISARQGEANPYVVCPGLVEAL